MKKLLGFTAVALVLQVIVLAQTPAPPKTTYILAGRLFDSTSDTIRQNMVTTVPRHAKPPVNRTSKVPHFWPVLPEVGILTSCVSSLERARLQPGRTNR